MLEDSPVEEKTYWEMMGVLPPEAMVSNAFLVGEPSDHGKDRSGLFGARYALYFKNGKGHFYGGLASISDFKTFLI